MASAKTYIIQTYQNKGKNKFIMELYREYKRFHKTAINIQYMLYKKNGYTDKYYNTKGYFSKLSERYKCQVMQQSSGQLDAWISKRDNKINKIINNCKTITNEQKRKIHLIKMFKIRRPQDWNVNNNKKDPLYIAISKDDIAIYKSICRSLKWRLPSSSKISMHLNNNTCKLIKKKIYKNNMAKSFEYWIALSSLIKGKKILIPARSNKYLNEKLKNGRLFNAIRIDFKNDTPIFNVLLKMNQKADNKYQMNQIGIDFGTKKLFALSNGIIYGVNFGKKLAKFDIIIQTLRKRLIKQGIKPFKSKKYINIKTKSKQFIKNEINRNLNKIIQVHNPKTLVVERLDFRNLKLSKSMNRMMSNCGRSVIRKKLIMMKEDLKIEVNEVNPAYSSRMCKRCGFVHKKNRKNRDKFNCNLCNYMKHADIQAARNIETRSSCPVLCGKACKRTIKQYLFDQFKQNMFQCDKSRNRFISPDRRAIFLQFNPKSFEEFAVLLQRNKQNLTKLK